MTAPTPISKRSALPHKSPPTNARAVRVGMWVVADDGQVGIVNAITPDGTAEFHRVGVDGLTQLVVMMPVTSLKQAKYEDIPESRRPAAGVARRYGYGT